MARVRLSLTALGLVLSLAACGGSGEDTTIPGALQQALRGEPGAEIVMADVVPGDWTRMLIFGPYTPPDTIDASLGFHWDGASGTHIDMLDAFTLIVFADEDRVMAWSMVSRAIAEWSNDALARSWSRAEARFRVSGTGGKAVLSPAQPSPSP